METVAAPFAKYRMFIGGRRVEAASGQRPVRPR